jgi:CDP-diacylglycerol--glycerol-3-phosphate 3-phosphatidyltransferase
VDAQGGLVKIALMQTTEVGPAAGAGPVMPGKFARDLRTAPNLVTLSRILLVAVSLVFYARGNVVGALVLGTTAGITDYLDGWLARRTGQVTRLGEILDQYCDIILEFGYLLMGVFAGLGVPMWVLPLYVFREAWVSAIRRWVAGVGGNIPSTIWGKAKSGFVGWSCVPLFIAPAATALGWPAVGLGLRRLGQAGLAVGLILSVVSAVQYTRGFIAVYDERAK